MCQATDKQIIEVLKMETIPALGCTEPVACALACARCKEELGGVPEHIEVFVSGNIYKNGMGVGIPGTGMSDFSELYKLLDFPARSLPSPLTFSGCTPVW